MENLWIYGLGLIAQLFFSARMIVQWVMSERSKKVVSPVIYWQLSLIASFLYVFYGWLRVDFAIILGQLFSYYIYIWNLNVQNRWKGINYALRILLFLTPPVVITLLAVTEIEAIERLWLDVSFGLLLFGSVGQIIFAFRFIYQWWYSRRFNQSILPVGFWILGIIGSISILIYGIIRRDPILILGQGAGFITYSRNLYLGRRGWRSGKGGKVRNDGMY